MCIDIVELWFVIANEQISSNFDGSIYPRLPIFSFPGDNCQGSFTKLGTCIDIKDIWFGFVNGQTSLMFERVICPRHDNGGVL